MKKTLLASMISMVCVNVYAIDSFTPLTAPATLGNTNEATAPFLLPAGWTQTLVTDRNTLNGMGLPSTFGNWDMVDVSPNGQYVYIPMEVQTGAGVIRYDRNSGDFTNLMVGNNTGVFSSNPGTWSATSDDFGAFDPAVLTPTGSLVVAEEWSGNGRIFEITNPETATGTGDANVNWLSNIPSVSHEGVKFDSAGSLYFVDESNTGSIYRFTPKNAGDYSVGSTSVLVDNDMPGSGDATANYNAAGVDRTGASTWVDITDIDGNALTVADPFDFTSRGGRTAADEVNGTPYGRPEDLEIGTLASGNEVLFWATTSENIVYALDLVTNEVLTFLDSDITPDSIGGGAPVGEGANDAAYGLDDPDNLFLAYGPNGELQLFIIEDENPGDIFMATDANGDGIAEKVDLFASLGPFGSEPTGFIADPLTGGFLVNIQHPSSGNDALWSITPAPVPVPAAVWLFGSALLGLMGVNRRKRV